MNPFRSFRSLLPVSVVDFFSKGSHRSVQAKRNILFSFVIKMLNILTGLILVPLTINYVDQTTYGIWLTLSSIIAWFGFFDIGLANGLRNKLTEAIAAKKFKLAKVYISTTYFVLAGISFLIMFLFLIISPLISWASVLNTDAGMDAELRKVATVVVTFFCLQFILQILSVVFNANQQPARAALLNFIGNLTALFVTAMLIYAGPGNLLLLSAAQSFAPVIVLLIASLLCYKTNLRQYAPSLKMVRLKFGRDLFNLGLRFFVIQLAVIVLYQTNNIIIAQLFEPADVIPFNIVFKYFAVVPMIFSIIISPFWSAVTEAWFKKDEIWIMNIMKKLRRAWLVMIMMVIMMVLTSEFVYKMWIGTQVSVSFNLTVSMAVYVLINAWNAIYSQFLNGVGMINLQLVLSVAGSFLNVPLSIFLCRKMGVHGVVVSTSIISIAGALLYPVQYKKLISRTATGIWGR